METRKKTKLSWLASALVVVPAFAAAAVVPAATAAGAASPNAGISPGEVVQLAGTPELWIADAQGVVHLVSDTRAAEGHEVNWSDRTEVTADQLGSLPRGEPWLTAALVRIGDQIYLPQWQTGAPEPTLYHVQSPADLNLMGVDGNDYWALVLDPQQWQERYGLDPQTLSQDELAALSQVLPQPPGSTDQPMSVEPQPSATEVPESPSPESATS
jgi:hypothetical protein